MRRTVAQVMEVSGFAAIIAGVYLTVGLGLALIAYGLLAAVASVALEMAR